MELALAGYGVATAFSGQDALETAARKQPHCGAARHRHAGMSGFEFARRIRLEAWSKDAKLIQLRAGARRRTNRWQWPLDSISVAASRNPDRDAIHAAQIRLLNETASGRSRPHCMRFDERR
jgi:CheY-like chemotaxis protein